MSCQDPFRHWFSKVTMPHPTRRVGHRGQLTQPSSSNSPPPSRGVWQICRNLYQNSAGNCPHLRRTDCWQHKGSRYLIQINSRVGGWCFGLHTSPLGRVPLFRFLSFWGPGTGREENCSAGGGGGDTEAHFPNPPPSLLGRRDGRGGSGQGCPTCRAGGGGGQPNIYGSKCYPRRADHFDYSNVGGGGDYWWKKLFRAKFFVFLHLWRQHPFLHKTKGQTRNPISPTPPPSFGGRPCHPPPPPRRAIFRSPSVNSAQHRRSAKSSLWTAFRLFYRTSRPLLFKGPRWWWWWGSIASTQHSITIEERQICLKLLFVQTAQQIAEVTMPNCPALGGAAPAYVLIVDPSVGRIAVGLAGRQRSERLIQGR